MNFLKNGHTYSFGLMLAIGVILISLVTVGEHPQAQNSCLIQPADMAAWYPGDGNTNDILQGTSGTRQGNTTYAVGQVGQALSLVDARRLRSLARLSRGFYFIVLRPPLLPEDYLGHRTMLFLDGNGD